MKTRVVTGLALALLSLVLTAEPFAQKESKAALESPALKRLETELRLRTQARDLFAELALFDDGSMVGRTLSTFEGRRDPSFATPGDRGGEIAEVEPVSTGSVGPAYEVTPGFDNGLTQIRSDIEVLKKTLQKLNDGTQKGTSEKGEKK